MGEAPEFVPDDWQLEPTAPDFTRAESLARDLTMYGETVAAVSGSAMHDHYGLSPFGFSDDPVTQFYFRNLLSGHEEISSQYESLDDPEMVAATYQEQVASGIIPMVNQVIVPVGRSSNHYVWSGFGATPSYIEVRTLDDDKGNKQTAVIYRDAKNLRNWQRIRLENGVLTDFASGFADDSVRTVDLCMVGQKDAEALEADLAYALFLAKHDLVKLDRPDWGTKQPPYVACVEAQIVYETSRELTYLRSLSEADLAEFLAEDIEAQPGITLEDALDLYIKQMTSSLKERLDDKRARDIDAEKDWFIESLDGIDYDPAELEAILSR